MWVMEDGSRQIKQGVNIATNSFTLDEVLFLADILKTKYDLKCTVIKTGVENQWRISIWKESIRLCFVFIYKKKHNLDE